MSDEINWEDLDVAEMEEKLLALDSPVLMNKIGRKPNTMFSMMRDHFGGGWFGIVWEYPADNDDSPIGTIRPFDTLQETLDWLMSVDSMNTLGND